MAGDNIGDMTNISYDEYTSMRIKSDDALSMGDTVVATSLGITKPDDSQDSDCYDGTTENLKESAIQYRTLAG